MREDGRILLIDPVSHHDPIEAIAAHWAVRARDGEDAVLLLKRHWPTIDRDRAEAWAALNALTLAAYLLHARRQIPEAVLRFFRPSQAHEQTRQQARRTTIRNVADQICKK